MNWRHRIYQALDPALDIEIEDERYLGDTVQHRAAAVLIPITDRAEPGVILTQRPTWLRSHAGQVAFPGGKIENNETPEAALVRELDESGHEWVFALREKCRRADFATERSSLEALFSEMDALLQARAEFMQRPVSAPREALVRDVHDGDGRARDARVGRRWEGRAVHARRAAAAAAAAAARRRGR
jgi:hypothetical protein